jgi:hypothetical protein
MRIWVLIFFVFGCLAMISLPSDASQYEALPDLAYEQPLDAEALKEIFSGQTHRGSYNFERPNMDGFHFEEWTSESGEVLHRMGDRLDMGRWEIVADQICYSYDSPDLLAACFSFYQKGNCIFHYQETVGGVVVPRFTAVSVIKGEVPNCEAPMS